MTVVPLDPPPLAGAIVLSVGHTLPGLYCLAALRDLGAEVVRIERPAVAAGADPYAALADAFPTRSLQAGTHALALDLKSASGLDAFRRMARRADVVLEGFRPGVARRLGIDYESLRAARPVLVYAAISGYGQSGPHESRVGHDVNYLAETGVLALSNPVGLPGATFADGMAGLSAALNIVAAMHGAARTGRGQLLDCAIVDGPLFLMASELEHFWQTGESRGAGDTHLSGRHPWYGVHATSDGESVAVGAVEPGFYTALCDGLGRSELAGRQYARGDELAAQSEEVASLFAEGTRSEALARFGGMDACVSPVLGTAEVAESPVLARVVREGGTAGERIVRSPVRLPPADLAPERSGATLLEEFGFSREDVSTLVREGNLGDGGPG